MESLKPVGMALKSCKDLKIRCNSSRRSVNQGRSQRGRSGEYALVALRDLSELDHQMGGDRNLPVVRAFAHDVQKPGTMPPTLLASAGSCVRPLLSCPRSSNDSFDTMS